MRCIMSSLHRWFVLTAVVVSPLLAGCASEDESTSDESSDSSPDAVTFNDRALANAARVEPDRLIFTRSFISGYRPVDAGGASQTLLERVAAYQAAVARGEASSAEPTYLVAGRADRATRADGTVDETVGNPFGFSRKLVGFTRRGNNIVFATEPASMDQVFRDVDVEGTIALRSELDASVNPVAGFAGTIPGPSIPRIDLSGRELWRRGRSVLRLGETYLDVSSTVDYALEINSNRVHKVRLVVNGQLDGQLMVEATTGVDLANHEVRRELYSTRLSLPPIAGMPLTLRIAVSAGCTYGGRAALTASAGVHATATASAGFEYERGSRRPRGIGDASFTATPIQPVFTLDGDAGLRCYVEPKYEVFLYDTVGSRNSINAYADLQFTSPPARVDMTAGLSGAVTGSLRVFSIELASLNIPVFDVRSPVYSGPSQ